MYDNKLTQNLSTLVTLLWTAIQIKVDQIKEPDQELDLH